MAKIQINFFKDDTNTTAYKAGDTIFVVGDPGDALYGVHQGEVMITYHDEVIRTVGPGGIFGEMAIADGKPRSAKAIAKTDCKLVVLDQAQFLFKIQHHPTFALFVIQTITERLREETMRR